MEQRQAIPARLSPNSCPTEYVSIIIWEIWSKLRALEYVWGKFVMQSW